MAYQEGGGDGWSGGQQSAASSTVPCSLCFESFSSVESLSFHKIEVHKALAPFKCEFCAARLVSLALVYKHVEESHPGVPPYHCLVCPYRFENQNQLSTHMFCAHLSEIFIFRCTECSEKFSTEMQLLNHTMTHPDTSLSNPAVLYGDTGTIGNGENHQDLMVASHESVSKHHQQSINQQILSIVTGGISNKSCTVQGCESAQVRFVQSKSMRLIIVVRPLTGTEEMNPYWEEVFVSCGCVVKWRQSDQVDIFEQDHCDNGNTIAHTLCSELNSKRFHQFVDLVNRFGCGEVFSWQNDLGDTVLHEALQVIKDIFPETLDMLAANCRFNFSIVNMNGEGVLDVAAKNAVSDAVRQRLIYYTAISSLPSSTKISTNGSQK